MCHSQAVLSYFHAMLCYTVLSEIAEEGNNGGSPTLVQSGEVDNLDGEELVARRERRRKNIVEELFDTEKTYLHHLEVTHKVCNLSTSLFCHKGATI